MHITYKDNFFFNFFFLTSDTDLKNAVDRVNKPFGGADLEKALELSRQLFDSSQGARPSARKILVLITDRESDSSVKDIEKLSKELELDYIRVIPVAMGGPGNEKEINVTTPIKSDVVKANKTTTPKEISKEIIKKADSGLFFNILVHEIKLNR